MASQNSPLDTRRSAMKEDKRASPAQDLIKICMRTFCDSMRLNRLLSNDPDLQIYAESRDDALQHCGQPILRLLLHLSNLVKAQVGDYDFIIQRLDDMISLATEKFYAFPFKDVPPCWQQLFREASLLKFSALSVRGNWGTVDNRQSGSTDIHSFDSGLMDEMVNVLDMALIMAGPPDSEAAQAGITNALDLLQQIHASSIHWDPELPATKRRKLEARRTEISDEFPVCSSCELPPVANPIPRKQLPTMDAFQNHMSRPSNLDLGPEPIIITGALDHWPARNENSWKSPGYLLSKTIGGRRLVPIELGRSYVDEGWGQKIVPFKEFMEQYILGAKSPALATGYLAQHNLFTQISSLRHDITVPHYCYTSPPPPHHSSPLAEKHSRMPELDEPLLNAWFGPAGTISPLHTDPYHNILSQVVGRKYIRLYAPRESSRLYARGIEDGGVDMENTSEVDIGLLSGWDGTEQESAEAHEKFPLFKDARFVDCILEEGECLYIPVGWWHYVRSLSVSFSVRRAYYIHLVNLISFVDHSSPNGLLYIDIKHLVQLVRPSMNTRNCLLSSRSASPRCPPCQSFTCDRVSPSCSQCIRARRVCPGYRSQLDLMFRNESDAVQVKAVKSKETSRTKSNVGGHLRTPASAKSGGGCYDDFSQGVEVAKSTMPNYSMCPTLEERSLAFFGLMAPTWFRAFDLLESMCVNAGIEEHLQAGISAVGLASFSNASHAPELMAKARRDYVKALHLTNKALRSPTAVKKDSTLFSVMVLSIYETISGSNERSLNSWAEHIQGAAALVNLRGREQFRDPAGQRMFLQVTSSLIVSCIQRTIPMPKHIIQLRDDAQKYMDTDNPAWRLSGIIIDFTIFRSEVRDCERVGPRKVIKHALEIDQRFIDEFEDPPEEWKYETVYTSKNPDLVWNGTFHVYREYWMSHVWNGMRTCRILLHELIRDQLLASSTAMTLLLADDENGIQLRASIGIMLEMQSEILASVPHHTPSLLNQSSSGLLDGSRSYFVLWPLFLVGSMDLTTESIRTWAAARLRNIGETVGIRQAIVISDMLIRQSLPRGWDTKPAPRLMPHQERIHAYWNGKKPDEFVESEFGQPSRIVEVGLAHV